MRIFQRGTNATGFVRRSIDRKSGSDLFGELAAAIVAGNEFEVFATLFAVAVFVLDAEVGQRNLAVNYPETVGFGDFFLSFFPLIRGNGFELCEIAVKVFLQFVIEDGAKIFSAISLDSCCGLLIKTIEG